MDADLTVNLDIDTGLIAIIITVAVVLLITILIGTYSCARGCLKSSKHYSEISTGRDYHQKSTMQKSHRYNLI